MPRWPAAYQPAKTARQPPARTTLKALRRQKSTKPASRRWKVIADRCGGALRRSMGQPARPAQLVWTAGTGVPRARQRRAGDSRFGSAVLLQNAARQFCGLPTQADEQFGTAAIRQDRPYLGTLGRDPADRTVRQHVDYPPSAAGLSHDIGQHMRLAEGCHDLGLHHPVTADGGNTGQDLEALAGIVVEVRDVGRDGIA